MITGAGRGLGLGLARVLAQDGNATIIGTVREPSAARELVALGARAVVMDVGSDDSIAAAVAELADIEAIDVLINNAGINAKAVGGSANWALSRALTVQASAFFDDYHLLVVPPPPSIPPPPTGDRLPPPAR